MKIWICFYFVLSLVILGQNVQLETMYISVGKSTLLVEIADTEPKRMRGLMHRKSLGPNEGMLFVFPRADLQSFWMKNTLIPLDIGYFSPDGTLIDVYTMKPNQIEETYNSTTKAIYALEVNAGYFAKNNIRKGDRLILEKRVSPR